MYWSYTAYLHHEMGNYDLAADAYIVATLIKPDDAIRYFTSGVWLGKLERHEEAIAAWKVRNGPHSTSL